MPLRNLSIIGLAFIVSLACYLRAARNRYVETLAAAMNVVSQEYVDEVDQRKLFEGAMDGMIGQLDEYSGYHPPEEYSQFQQDIDQHFGGIGIQMEHDPEKKKFTVVMSMIGTPAYEAGLKSGDLLLSIDGTSTAELSLDELSGRIKGAPGTKVALELLHAGEKSPVKVEVTRANIAVDSVRGDLRGPDGKWTFRLAEKPQIGYVRLTTFGERTAGELHAALADLAKEGDDVQGLILDLRGNEGGLLDAAVEVCDMFLDEGLIVRTVGRHQRSHEQHDASRGMDISPKVPMVVMVDRFSASASEIVAACLQDHQRAVVVGQRSWGKGTVQNVKQMGGDRGAIRLTIARYFRPNGRNIHKTRGAADGDEWGVRPNAGCDVVLTDDQYQRWRLERRQRDQLTDGGKVVWRAAEEPAPSEAFVAAPPIPPPESPSAQAAAPQAAPAPSGDSALSADPQLRKAVEQLREKTHSPSPGRA